MSRLNRRHICSRLLDLSLGPLNIFIDFIALNNSAHGSLCLSVLVDLGFIKGMMWTIH